jgi:hypothetical protein
MIFSAIEMKEKLENGWGWGQKDQPQTDGD